MEESITAFISFESYLDNYPKGCTLKRDLKKYRLCQNYRIYRQGIKYYCKLLSIPLINDIFKLTIYSFYQINFKYFQLPINLKRLFHILR
jgi:hypothetical protein